MPAGIGESIGTFTVCGRPERGKKGRKLPRTGVFALVLQCLKQLPSAESDRAVARFVAVRTHPLQHRLLDIRL